MGKANYAAAAVGVIDLHMARGTVSTDTISYHAEANDSETLRDVARKSELRNRQANKAAQEWAKLRADALSYDRINAWKRGVVR